MQTRADMGMHVGVAQLVRQGEVVQTVGIWQWAFIWERHDC